MVTTRSGASSAPHEAGGGPGAGKLLIKALVTGGAGFLGRHVVRKLLDSGRYEVHVFDVRTLDEPRPHSSRVGDLRKPEDVAAAVEGMDVVFHIATAAPTGENALNIALMNGVNVDGTRHLLDACVAAGVPKVVYTSSASVVFDGKPLYMVDESTPYAKRPMDHYTRTKIQGEQMVLEYNGRELSGTALCSGNEAPTKLSTVALRPSGIFGEGDAVFVPTLVRNARAGKMKYVLGSGANQCDFTYAGNVAHAHLLAAEALSPASLIAGKAYFITNNEPKPFWGMMGDVCEGLGYGRPRIHLPFMLVFVLAMIFEYVVRPLVRLLGKELRSDFTVNRILIATTNRTFSTAQARKDFGYAPTIKLSDAIAKTLASFQELRADHTQQQQQQVGSSGAGVKKAD
ncbi:hypothetical protein VOLCADRAFT_79975 [Volvox carteri f. nagariensis]|uniref:3-beta hydroxysteroid dehydrogenase/isomerase domain-containing protein n=1 Tax=Volvox carteri f. nagariensis TaxID=3068 RepID=D8TNW8_VOLCA|nr:uncharacterized protein VOLCADRAFT_79975 [Volvox carteri f. nagariensis]EFJ50914.1 hypothetical protein VOLCADRAFT_79975 [Volvox carteri f. nagariensis]|eukprot:XP_002947926.1 hypothetical protein VOLCADRAFT_79975 [Volvox carteri f. nagariensis]